jgi:hypothetical protein
MSSVKKPVRDIADKVGLGGIAAIAIGAVLIAGVTAVGAANGADDRPSANPVTISMPGDDDGTPDQGSGDAPGTPGATSTTVTSTTVASTPTTSTTVAPTPAPPAAATRTIPVPGVGTVVINEGAALGLVSATPAAGFTVRTEASAREIHVRFFDAFGGRIDVKAEIEDGAVRIRIRDRRFEDEDRSGSGRGGDDDRPSTTVPSAPTPTIDDHGGDRDRDDRVESGDDRDDDSSGRGRGGDDDRDDDRDDD